MKLKTILTSCVAIAACTIALNANAEHLKSLNPSYIDNNVKAGNDFYKHVNAGWQKAHPLTPEYSRYGQFNILNDSNNIRVQNIVTGLADTNPEPGSVAFKVATIYTQAMDSTRRNAEGAKPILPLLARIENAKAGAEMDSLFFWLHKEYGSPFISAGPQEDLANSNAYAMYIGGAGLVLGDRDYYLKNDKENTKILNAYKKLIDTQMRNAGYSKKDAARIARNVIKIETLIADSTWTREQSRNIVAMYNPFTIEQLRETYPGIDWDSFFVRTMGIETPKTFIVTNPNTVKQGENLLKSLNDREIKDYYLWEIVSGAASKLSDDFSVAAFEFNKVMSGVQQQRPRWKRALAATERAMGEAIGQLYVDKYFPASSKEYMINLVENLRIALGKHIINLTWMSDETKLKAINKLNAFTVKIGYPDKWKDYTTLEIDPNLSYYENMHNVGMWDQNDMLSKWGKPVDKSQWFMTPQTINAYYNPTANEIVFPAGILQAPFFDPEASDAENYGAIGVVIGHEMTHGFDDQGCNFDADGNMVNWWTAEDAEAFKALTHGLVDQFNQVEVLPGLMANGEYCLGENIADQGGLRVARTAFIDSQKKKGVDINAPESNIEGFTPMQVFYMNYANVWAQNIRDEEKRNLTMGDVHSLGENRVNVTLRNITPFFEAFGITEGDALYRPESEQVIIW